MNITNHVKVNITKVFNPYYKGKERAVGEDLDVPIEFSIDYGCQHRPIKPTCQQPYVPKEGDLNPEQVMIELSTNFFNNTPVFQPTHNGEIAEVL